MHRISSVNRRARFLPGLKAEVSARKTDELANRGTDTRTLQGFMGHRSIQSTVRYAALASGRFKNIWR
jgi:hypothetical protein